MPPRGKTYGRFSGRGGSSRNRAHEIMAMAKQQGARVRGLEAYYDFQEAVRKEATKAEMAASKGILGGSIGGAIGSYLMPGILGAVGLGTGGIGSFLLASALGAAGTGVSTSFGDALARQWSMGGGLGGASKLMKGDLTFKDFLTDVSGPYGRSFIGKLGRDATDDYQKEIDEKSQYVNMLKSSRMVENIFSGLLSAGKVAGATTESIADLGSKPFGELSMVERFEKAMQADFNIGGASVEGINVPGVFGRTEVGVPDALSNIADKITGMDIFEKKEGGGYTKRRKPNVWDYIFPLIPKQPWVK